MWAQLRRFSGLPSAAKVDFLGALVLLPLIRVSLKLRGFQSTQAFLQKRASEAPQQSRATDTATEAQAQQTSRMVLAAARRVPAQTNCLERSLTLWWLLARKGIASQLRIGARKTGEKFEAHAWVEMNGEAIGEPEGSHLHYAAFGKEFSGDPS